MIKYMIFSPPAFKPNQSKRSLSNRNNFQLNNDGKLIINDEDNIKDEDTPLNIGATDILGGRLKVLFYS